MITLRTPELQAASIPDNCAEVAGDVETYTVKPRRADVKVQLASVGWAAYCEVGYSSARGNVTQTASVRGRQLPNCRAPPFRNSIGPGRLSPGLLPVIQLSRPDEGVYRTE